MKLTASLKPRVSLFLKIAISGGLLAWVLIDFVDWSTLPMILGQANLWLIALAFSLHIPGFIFIARR